MTKEYKQNAAHKTLQKQLHILSRRREDPSRRAVRQYSVRKVKAREIPKHVDCISSLETLSKSRMLTELDNLSILKQDSTAPDHVVRNIYTALLIL